MQETKKKKPAFINQYKLATFKPQFAAAFLNGNIFGLVYSFYYLPFDFERQNVRLKYRNSRFLYTLSGVARCGLAFALIRCTYSFTENNHFSYPVTIGIMGSTIAGVAMFLL